MKGLTKLLILTSISLLNYLDTSGSTAAATASTAAEAEAKAEDKKTKAVMILPDIQKQKRGSELSHSHDGFEKPSPTTNSAQRDLKKKKQPPAPANKRTRARASEPEGKGDKNKKTAPNPGVRPKRYREHQCTMKPFLGRWIYQNGCGGDPWMVHISCEKKGRRGGGLMCSYYEEDEDSGYCAYIGDFNSKDSLHPDPDGKGNCLLGPINLHPDATVDDEDCSLNSPELMVKIMPVNEFELKIYFSQDGGDSFYTRDAIPIYGYGADGKNSGGSSKGGKKIDRRLVEKTKTKSHLERKLCEESEPRCVPATGSFDSDSKTDVCWKAENKEQYCWSKTFFEPPSTFYKCKPEGGWEEVQYRRSECGSACQNFEDYCFPDRNQLKTAVDKYVKSNCKEGAGNGDNCKVLTSKYGWPMNSWCVGKVTDMHNLFSGFGVSWMKEFNDDISSWDVSQVQDMREMFWDATSFNNDISGWDVSQVTDMSGMFWGAQEFNGDLSLWDVSQAQDMGGMFRDAISFNQDLSSWNVSHVQHMSGMFYGAYRFNGDLSSWDVSQVLDMREMFRDSISFTGDLSLWNVGQVTDMSWMFAYASSFNGDVSSWDISQVQDMRWMFQEASSFNQNLCAWGNKNFPYTRAAYIFAYSGCNYKDKPKEDQGGPFCASTCK